MRRPSNYFKMLVLAFAVAAGGCVPSFGPTTGRAAPSAPATTPALELPIERQIESKSEEGEPSKNGHDWWKVGALAVVVPIAMSVFVVGGLD